MTSRPTWRAITLATLVVVPAYWSVLAGLVSLALDDGDALAHPEVAIAVGLSLVPFAFTVLAYFSEQPRVPIAVALAIGAAVLVGVTVSAIAADAVTGLVAGIGAGGIFALRPDAEVGLRPRVVALAVVCAYTFVLAQAAPTLALLPAPFFPFAALGLADHLAERRQELSGAGT
jgi:hypothetical protein